MSDGTEQERKLREKANRLYWDSDRSVNQIADDLGLSKSALYGYIEPIPADAGCPDCGGELVFANRTAQEREMVHCPTCDFEGELDDAADAAPRGAANSAGSADPGSSGIRFPELTGADRWLAAGAVLGVAAGILWIGWRRRG